MDATNANNFQSNVMSANTSRTYSPQPGATSTAPPETRPPLQPQNTSLQPVYSTPTPRTPSTPSNPGSTSGYVPPTTSIPPSTRPAYMMSNPQYQPQLPPYVPPSSMLPQTTSSASHPHLIAPALAPAPVSRPASAATPPALRPIASGSVMPAPGMGYGQNIAPQPSIQGDPKKPASVVGSQGRRGILPSAPGRPPATPAGATGPKTTAPVKDADGKFPCPHCVKTYLHAKHLKRHLLRHTGDRPYMCVLCRDTFSRSDILKRHFQKCSIRRGNPTGVSHLSDPTANVKKYKEMMRKAALDDSGDLGQINGLGNMPNENIVHQYGGIPVTEDPSRDRRAISGPVMGGSTYSSDVPTTMTSSMNPQIGQYNMPQGQNGMPIFPTGSNSNQQSNVDWSQMFQADPDRNQRS